MSESPLPLNCCPLCKSETMKIIYFGLPGRLCGNPGCHCLTGLAAYAPAIANADGEFAFFAYEDSYWKALWRYFRGESQ